MRFRAIDYAKGLAILGIVYLHGAGSLVLAGLRPQTPLNVALHAMFDKSSVAVFFLASGLFVARSLEKAGAGAFVWAKAWALLYPYLIWSVLKGGLQIALSGQTNTQRGFSDLAAIWYEPLGHLWFFYALFLVCVVYAIFGRMRHSTTILLVVALAIFFLPKLPFTLYAKSAENFIFFMLGVALSKRVQNGWRPTIPPLVLLPLAFLTFAYGYWILPANLRVPLAVIGFIVPAIALIYGTSTHLDQKNWLPFLAYLGKHSLGIYVAHTIVQAAIRIVASRLLNITNPSLLLVLVLVLGTVIPLGLYVVSQRVNFPYLYQWSALKRHNLLVPKGLENA